VLALYDDWADVKVSVTEDGTVYRVLVMGNISLPVNR